VSLDPRGATVSRQLTAWAGGARGRLRAPGVPGQASPPTVLVHDPGDPFPSSRHSDDHRLPVARADVVSWFSASLAGPLGWFGRAQCRMEVCAPTHGCDVVVTLLHERAGGERTRLLDSAVEVAAGRTKVVVTFPPAAVEIPAGHRIGVEVTTSRFPRFARAIPGADRWQAASGPTVEITVAPAAGGLLWLPEVTWPSDAAAPARPSGEELGAGSNLATLVDERTGVVTAVEPVATAPGAPPWAHLYAGAVADIGAHLPWPADRVTTGMAVADRQRAWSSAVGEAVERYCGNFVPAGLRRASFDELAREGRAAVDPRTLALYSPSQHAAPGFPFEPFTTGLRVRWAEGYTLDDGLPVLVPASLAYVNYHHLAGEGEPLTNYVNLAGIAAGPDLQAAETAAMEELMERDATMIWWHNALAARPVEVDDLRLAPWLRPCPELGPGWAQAAGVESPWRYRLVAIPTTLDVAVIGALVHDPEAGIVGLGVAARPDPVAAVHKAIVEAVSLHFYACGLDDPAGAIWELSESGLFDGSVLKPHRADRRYRDDYRSDWRDVLDLACHSQLWLDPRMEPALAPIVGEAPPVTLDRLPKVTGDVRAGYIRRLLAQGLRPCAVDMTTPDVAATGARVVRVVAPGAYSNPPAAFAFLGGRRLYTDPVVLGLREVAAEEEELVLAPLPHT
jgi:ribosomal protein S12 methylthiotransferase accessory factor